MIKNRMKGEFQFFNKKNGELIPLLDGAVSRNLIVDQFFGCIGSGVNGGNNARMRNTVTTLTGVPRFNRYFAVGTGTLEPTPSDVSLGNQIASVLNQTGATVQNTYSYNDVDDTLTFVATMTQSFPLGSVRANISEVGVRAESTTAPWNIQFLQSRALIKDSLGNPTTISLGAEDQLVVVYTLTRTCNRSFSGTVNGIGYEGKLVGYSGFQDSIASGAINLNIAPQNEVRITNQDWAFPDFNGTTFPNATNLTLTAVDVQNLNTKQSRCRVRLPLNVGNFAEGLKGVYLSRMNIQIKFTTPIMKTNEDILDIEFFTSFENVT